MNPEQNYDADPVVLGSQSKTCPFCQKSHALEDCRFLRWKPYQEQIKFLSSMRLCFGCLSDNHVARLCPQRKVCKIPNCSRKHPTVLHTTSVREKSSVDIGVGTENIADTQVSNAMASTAQHANTLNGDSRSLEMLFPAFWHQIQYLIDLFHKWRLFYFRSVIVQITLPSLPLVQEFFSI